MSFINEEDIQEIIETVWMTVLELPIELSQDFDLSIEDCLGAEIEISGAWNGIVAVKASRVFLVYAASQMFSCAESEVNDSDCADTLTELTNMLGGTVKCLLPEVCDLSLPTMKVDTLDVNDADWVRFECSDNLVAVCVSEMAKDRQISA